MAKIPLDDRNGSGYRLYDGKYPSVSDVLDLIAKGHIKRWRESVGEEAAERIRDEATTLGTAVHAVAHKMAKAHGTELEVPVTPEIYPYCAAVEAFLDGWVDEVIATEQQLASSTYGFGGTFDLVARVKPAKGGGIAVVDYKVAKKLTRENNMQTAAYQILAREAGYDVDRRLIVWLKKPPAYTPGEWFVRKCEGPKFENDERGFIGLLNYLYFKDNEYFRKLQAA